MNYAAIVALLGDLYTQVTNLQQRVQELTEENQKLQAMPPARPENV